MRHRRKGRKLGRSPKHQRALLRNLTISLFLTEREHDEGDDGNPPGTPGRIETTLAKAKEVRPLVEKCITIARRSLAAKERAEELDTEAERHSDEWQAWRKGDGWQEWAAANAPVLAARRRVLKILSQGKHRRKKEVRVFKPAAKQAVDILFEEIAPRFADRNGGYTRVLRLAKPRLGDAGPRAILELVGKDDRRMEAAEAPALEQVETEDVEETAAEPVATATAQEQTAEDQASQEQPTEPQEKKEDG